MPSASDDPDERLSCEGVGPRGQAHTAFGRRPRAPRACSSARHGEGRRDRRPGRPHVRPRTRTHANPCALPRQSPSRPPLLGIQPAPPPFALRHEMPVARLTEAHRRAVIGVSKYRRMNFPVAVEHVAGDVWPIGGGESPGRRRRGCGTPNGALPPMTDLRARDHCRADERDIRQPALENVLDARHRIDLGADDVDADRGAERPARSALSRRRRRPGRT